MAKTHNSSFLVLEMTHSYSFVELCEMCRIKSDVVLELIEYGILESSSTSELSTAEQHVNIQNKKQLIPEKMQFSDQQAHRLRRALRLQRDLELNWPGVALALDLLEKIETMEQEIEALEYQLRR